MIGADLLPCDRRVFLVANFGPSTHLAAPDPILACRKRDNPSDPETAPETTAAR
jgi:hypothetical protein